MSNTKPHWLCRLGWHRWEREQLSEAINWTNETLSVVTLWRHWTQRRCVRPNCKRAEWEDA